VKGKVEYTSFRPLRRLSYDLTTYDRYVQHIRKEGYIGEGTPVKMDWFLSELQNFLLCGKITLSGMYRSSIIEDLSYGFFSFGNASGGSFPGYYRSFIVQDLDGKFDIYRIGMFGTPILVDDPVYGNRTGNTYLTVAKDQTGNSSNILQLNIDQFFTYSKGKDFYKVWHNGRRNGYKNKEVIESVEKFTPDLMLAGELYLGSLPAHRSITSEDGSDFIERLIEYACLRAKLAQKRKKKGN